eukprot:gene1891-1032_t
MNENIEGDNKLTQENITKFIKKNWKIMTTVFSIGFILFLISKKKSKVKDQIIQNVRSALKLPVNPDPRWKVYRSFIQEENPLKQTTGILRVRSTTRIGSDAEISRTGDYLIDNLKIWLNNIFVRAPNAIKTWSIWLSAASYGLFYFLKSGHFQQDEEEGTLDKILQEPLKKCSTRHSSLKNSKQVAINLEEKFKELIQKKSETSIL